MAMLKADHKYALVNYEQNSKTQYKIVDNSKLADTEKPNTKCYISSDQNESFTCLVITTSNDENDLKILIGHMLAKNLDNITTENAAQASYTPTRNYIVKDQSKRTTNGNNDDPTITLGPNGNTLSGCCKNLINWDSFQSATNGLLNVLFTKDVLATHVLPRGSNVSPKLDQRKVDDLVYFVTSKYNVTEEAVFREISYRCHYEYKMYMQERFYQNPCI
ncbi:PREDICTED: uncharacterized protein LOC108569924 [Nicrophorus vespilloides]|uniref:Uncharacterized protein LOC108569924 n=1 Tax=Nicrophorus vespilloides TaxID=110193 RepID=A0ABM1NK32_NICVS|nr:PREDICTED: uncharacterized protein LOC108569924 [Nicrophorus vespilloides]